jgi:hypothetical protein
LLFSLVEDVANDLSRNCGGTMARRNRIRHYAKKGKRRALLVLPAAALVAPFAIGLQPAAAASQTDLGSASHSLTFKNPQGQTISCELVQHAISSYHNDSQLGYMETRVDGTASECTSGLTLTIQAFWTDPSGNRAASNAEGGQVGVRSYAREYAPIGEVSQGNPFTGRAIVHFINCVNGTPAGNQCDFDISTNFAPK